jgi:hypothetical protein
MRVPKRFFDLRLRSLILADWEPNVLQRLFACCALAVATRDIITPDRKALFGFNERHAIIHLQKMQYVESFLNTFFLADRSNQLRSEAGSFSPARAGLIRSAPLMRGVFVWD